MVEDMRGLVTCIPDSWQVVTVQQESGVVVLVVALTFQSDNLCIDVMIIDNRHHAAAIY